MPTTLPRGTSARAYAAPTGVTARCAAAWGSASPNAAHVKVQHALAVLRDYLGFCRVEGAHARARAVLLDLMVQARGQRQPLTAALLRRAQLADLAEDVAEANFHAEPTREHRLAWRSAIARELAELEQLYESLGD